MQLTISFIVGYFPPSFLFLLDMRVLAFNNSRVSEIKSSAASSTNFTQGKQHETMQAILENYDAKVPPCFEHDMPTEITVQLFINSFDSINDEGMDFSVSLYLRQTWNDPRLKYEKIDQVYKLEFHPSLMDKIWVPDLFFSNEKEGRKHDITVPNKMMHVLPNGDILYSMRISMTLSCDMIHQKFPFDTQICHITMESYIYTVNNIVFKWHQTPVKFRENLQILKFHISKNTNVDCTNVYENDIGKYTCIQAVFHLSREYGFYIAQVYVPSVLIVILSWLSFWLDVSAVPARISLGVLTALTMSTQSVKGGNGNTQSSIVKAIDVWLGMCLLFVFAALVEFAFVNVYARAKTPRLGAKKNYGGWKFSINSNNKAVFRTGSLESRSSCEDEEEYEEDEDTKPTKHRIDTVYGRSKAKRLDRAARIAFPLAFLLFNVIYWSIYMAWDPHETSHV